MLKCLSYCRALPNKSVQQYYPRFCQSHDSVSHSRLQDSRLTGEATNNMRLQQ